MRHERRRHPRLEIPLETELRLAGSGQELSVTMQDLSAGGAGLLTTSEIPVGTDIEWFRFDLPATDDAESQPVEVAARVARCEQQAGLGGEAEFLIGLQFVDITRELFDRIQQFVFQRLRADTKERVQIERPIAIRFDRFDDFVDEVSVNLSASGMFIRTRDPRPPGSVFNFQFQLGDDFSLIEGRAEVVWRRRQSEGPEKLPGMGVRFVNLDVPSQRLIDRLIVQRHEAEAAATTAPPADEGEPIPAAPDSDEPETAEEAAPAEAAPEARLPPPDLERAEAAIVSLREVNSLRDAADRLRDELDEARREHERELHELRVQLEDRQAAASSELEERLREAESAHRESERQRGELTGEIEDARQEAAELRQQIAEAASEEELEQLIGERDATRTTQDRLLADLDRANGEADEMRRQLADRAAEVERLTSEHDGLKAAYDDLQAAHDEIQTARSGLQTDLGQARDEAAALQAQLDDRTLEERVEQLSAERDALRATQDRLLGDIDRANAEADEIRLQLADQSAGQEIERLVGERTEIQSAHDELQTANTEAQAARADLQSRLEATQQEAERLRRSGEATVLQLQADHSAALEQTVAEAREKAAARLEELAAAREERDRLEAEAARERDDLREEAAAAARETAAELDGLRLELTEARDRGAAFEADLESLRQELEESRAADDDEARAALTAAREESDHLRSALDSSEKDRLAIESRFQQARDGARQAAAHAEERETALRVEAENALLTATGGAPLPVPEPRRGRRVAAGAALLLIGALLGLLAVSFFQPLGSLAARLRPGADRTTIAAAATSPGTASADPSQAATEPQGEPLAGVAIEEPAATATPAQAEPQPQAEPGPDPAAAEQAVRDWAAAWSDQRVDDYLASYGESFQPPEGQSRDAWAADRRLRILQPRLIEVRVEAARTVELSSGRVSVSFDQRYVSDSFSDRVRKTLLLEWQDGAWKIAEERIIE